MSLKKICKNIYSFTTNVFQSAISLISILLFSSCSAAKMMTSISIPNKRSECCVLGNGPSLNDALAMSPSPFLGKDLMVVNFFLETDYFEILKPSYYIMLDNLFFSDNVDFFREERNAKAIDRLNTINWEMILFVPIIARKSMLIKRIINYKIKIIYFNSTPISGFRKIEYYYYDKNLGMPTAQTVINAAIFLAIKLDYKIINLYGVDQSWLKGMYVDENNIVRAGLDHFYGGSSSIGSIPSLSNLLLTQYNAFFSHERLQVYSKEKGIKILNHTKLSYIDAYEKVK